MTDPPLVWAVLALPPAQRRQAAREAGTTLTAVILAAKALLDDEASWAQWPAQCRRFEGELARGRSMRDGLSVHARRS